MHSHLGHYRARPAPLSAGARRSIVTSLLMPLVQLVFLGYAFGGQVKTRPATSGVVDSRITGMPAVQLKEMFQAVARECGRAFDTAAITAAMSTAHSTICATARSTPC